MRPRRPQHRLGHCQVLDFRRFTSDMYLECRIAERVGVTVLRP